MTRGDIDCGKVGVLPARFIADLLHVGEYVWHHRPGLTYKFSEMRTRILDHHAKMTGFARAIVVDDSGAPKPEKIISQYDFAGRHFYTNHNDFGVDMLAENVSLPQETFDDTRHDYGEEPCVLATYMLAYLTHEPLICFYPDGSAHKELGSNRFNSVLACVADYASGMAGQSSLYDCLRMILTRSDDPAKRVLLRQYLEWCNQQPEGSPDVDSEVQPERGGSPERSYAVR